MMPRKYLIKHSKIAAVKLILEEGQSVKMVSSTLEGHPNRLYRWIQEYEKYGERALGQEALFVMSNLSLKTWKRK